MASNDNDETKIHVPDECLDVKALFFERPRETLIREIKQFIASNPYPHLWWGHTHTKPPKGSKPIYIDEFDLPPASMKSRHWAPCPCCSPSHPKYGHNGKIAWFPDEGVIRLLGPDCFAAMDKEGHAAAIDEMRKEKKRRQDTNYLFKNREALLELPKILKIARRVGYGVDELKAGLRYAFIEQLNIPIWESVRTGKLQVWEEFDDLDRAGNVRTLNRLREYAPVLGIAMLNPEKKGMALRANQFLKGVAFIEERGWSERIDEMNEFERRQTAQFISNTVGKVRRFMADLAEAQKFLSDLNIATLRTWSARPDCPTPFVLERKGNILRIGKQANAMFTVRIPSNIEEPLVRINIPILKEMPDEDVAAAA